MNPTIVSSLISAGVTLLICIITTKAESSKTRILMDYRLEQLEKKVDKHNSLIERTYRLEEQAAIHDERIRVANHRIDDLERGAHE